MPELNWNDLHVLLAISRAHTLAVAARLLHIDETTVARRLAVAETAAGTRLFQRVGGGMLRPTDAGEAAVTAAERMEQAVDTLHASVTQARCVIAGISSDGRAADIHHQRACKRLIGRLVLSAFRDSSR